MFNLTDDTDAGVVVSGVGGSGCSSSSGPLGNSDVGSCFLTVVIVIVVSE